ncbi:LOW QUALITY PROTEIN: uncharacterized protein EMH_0093290 [Eimeria mitis]|uniref:Uncharacterized protein n=1 Tax=Eimeria mitis TaxID=44415 RepID=U6KDL6_9EIME|nr:LOW QUALITY PROTEIN: uncharacterized protein EMH_0093290 [Eimeria mitis]CDJ34856.1 hypothetical protein, conserved [Eimeria mitis]
MGGSLPSACSVVYHQGFCCLAAPSQESGSAEQLASSTELPTDATVISHFKWLGELFPDIPESILRTHPFYRHPQNEHIRISRSFDARSRLRPPAQKSPGPALTVCKEILKKLSLSPQDLMQLLKQAERLYGYASQTMALNYRRAQPLYAIETLGAIFLVLDTLYCAAEVLGDYSMKQDWWPSIVHRIEAARFVPKKEHLRCDKSVRNLHIALTLDAALEYYRKGIRPPLLMVIGLKEALFCGPGSTRFKSPQWDPWRQDAAQWRVSIQPILAKIKFSTVWMGGKG